MDRFGTPVFRKPSVLRWQRSSDEYQDATRRDLGAEVPGNAVATRNPTAAIARCIFNEAG